MSRTVFSVYVLGWAWVVSCVLTVFGFMAMGILLEGGKDEPWGELSFMFMVITAISGIAMTMWSAYLNDQNMLHRPEKKQKLSRADRKTLKAEQSRIALEQSIREAEHRAGISS